MATWAGNIVQAMPAADGGVAAVALDAQARVVDTEGHAGSPSKRCTVVPRPRYSTPRDRWCPISIRRARPGSGSAWRRIGRRPALTLPILNCAATLRLNPRDETLSAVSLALGPAAALPFRARDAERFLIGHALDDNAIEHAAALAQAECHLRSNPLRASKEYRAALVPILVRQALSEARDQALEDFAR